jgi:hypothetical protein
VDLEGPTGRPEHLPQFSQNEVAWLGLAGYREVVAPRLFPHLVRHPRLALPPAAEHGRVERQEQSAASRDTPDLQQGPDGAGSVVEGVVGHHEVEKTRLEGKALHLPLRPLEEDARREERIHRQEPPLRVEIEPHGGDPVPLAEELQAGPARAGPDLEYGPRTFSEPLGSEGEALLEPEASAGVVRALVVAPGTLLELECRLDLPPAFLREKPVDPSFGCEPPLLGGAEEAVGLLLEARCAVRAAPVEGRQPVPDLDSLGSQVPLPSRSPLSGERTPWSQSIGAPKGGSTP